MPELPALGGAVDFQWQAVLLSLAPEDGEGLLHEETPVPRLDRQTLILGLRKPFSGLAPNGPDPVGG